MFRGKTMQMDDDGGYIVVETVGAFIPFLFMVVAILSLVNIVTLQARMHYALTQAANTLAMYSYALEVTGIANGLSTLDNKADKVSREANAMRNDVEGVLSGIESFSDISGAAGHGEAAVTRAFDWGEEAAGNPKEVLQKLMNYGLNEVRGQLFEELARPLVGRYLANGEMTGDQYLRSVGVVNSSNGQAGLDAIEFHKWGNLGMGNSAVVDKDGNVKLVAHYEIKYTFGVLPLPFEPTLRITQTAITRAWLNGSGKGYW